MRAVSTTAIILAVIALTGRVDPVAGADVQSPTTAPSIVAPPWLGHDSATWPQIVLANHIVFNNGQVLEGASCFLMRLPDGAVVGCTAKHVLGDDIKLASLNSTLKTWNMYPRTREAQQTPMRELALDPALAESHDWLIVLAANQKGPWPAEVLPARQTPLEVGETVYVLGVPYGENKAQNVYPGKVMERRSDEGFEFQINTTFETRGFSGAPIIDAQGRLAAVYTAHLTKQPVAGKLMLIGVDTSSILPAIKLPADFKPAPVSVTHSNNAAAIRTTTTQPTPAATRRVPTSRPASDPEAEAAALLRAGQMFYDNKMYAEAENKLERLLNQYPGSRAAAKASELLKQVQAAK